ncbi:MAG: hypothetical protein CME65_01125 [Halobacteriovoraceae bacterium]|nr:hypothetical protein [Halobacteriovoraceae bacterium]|tara:strand:- start:5713 stop:5946 length:234 start_codon:yes stop_codon:yes gene_type:complete
METLRFTISSGLILSALCLSLRKTEELQCQKYKAHTKIQNELKNRFKIKTLPSLSFLNFCPTPKTNSYRLNGGVDFE